MDQLKATFCSFIAQFIYFCLMVIFKRTIILSFATSFFQGIAKSFVDLPESASHRWTVTHSALRTRHLQQRSPRGCEIFLKFSANNFCIFRSPCRICELFEMVECGLRRTRCCAEHDRSTGSTSLLDLSMTYSWTMLQRPA